jgi:hypothetical protein
MPDVLRVAAFELGHPLAVRILVKADDATPHQAPSLIAQTEE